MLTPGWRGRPEWGFVHLPYLAANVKGQSDENNIEKKSINTKSNFCCLVVQKINYKQLHTVLILKIISVSLFTALEAVILIMRSEHTVTEVNNEPENIINQMRL